MAVTACDACGSLLTIMMRAGRPWGRVRVFWGKFRSGIEGRMVGVRERERWHRGRQCEREPESKEGLVPHPSQPTCWVPTSGFYVCKASQARTRSLLSSFFPLSLIARLDRQGLSETSFAITPLWLSTSFGRLFVGCQFRHTLLWGDHITGCSAVQVTPNWSAV
jgi:hypothetical protein